ncbi:MAG TPA: hypothetical protein EYG89_04880 [Bacteroidia bacterium]|nr:hypothetical protein [Bacteroidia bacterium]
MPEVCGDLAKYFMPHNVDSISQSILEVISSKEYQNNLIKRGLIQSSSFTWDKHVDKIFQSL